MALLYVSFDSADAVYQVFGQEYLKNRGASGPGAHHTQNDTLWESEVLFDGTYPTA